MQPQMLLFWLVGFTFLLLSECSVSQEDAPEKQPPGYTVADITFVGFDEVELFGRLVLPKTGSPRAVVIYVQTAEGSTVDMKRSLGAGRTFNYYDLYRDQLTAMGIGFFSYEGRGVRMGDDLPRYEKIDRDLYNTSTLDNKVNDLVSAIEAVRKQDGLRPTPILLMGASEGTLLVAEAAARQPDTVAGVVLYGVLAKNMRENFRYIMSDGEFLKYRSLDKNADGVITKSEWDSVVKDVDFLKVDLNSDGEFTVADIELSTKKYLDAIDNEDYEVLHAWAKIGAAVAIPDGWFEDHFSHADIWSSLSKLDIPVGFFQGTADRMTPVSAVRELEEKAQQANLIKMEFHYFEGLGHSLKIGQYFVNGDIPKGHRSIFEFIDRIAPAVQR